MKKGIFRIVATLALLAVFASGAIAAWKPAKNLNVIVPWNPGGASDLTARMVASEMEKPLGVRISITNTPGGSGAIGTKNMFEAPHDGYTLSGNATNSIVTYQAMELLPNSHKEYNSYLAVFTPNVICVGADSKIKDIPDLLATMKARKVTVGSAGVGAGGHQAAEFFKAATGFAYTHVPYAGGAPAVTATVSGEVEVVMQLSMEVVEMLRAKQLRALAVMDKEPLEVEGYGTIPAVTKWIPNLPTVGSYFGLFATKDIPAEANQGIIDAFKVACNSKAVKDFAISKGAKPVCIYGAEADRISDEAASLICWVLYDNGVIKTSPEKFAIPRAK